MSPCEKLDFARTMLAELRALFQPGEADVLLYLIDMAAIEAAELCDDPPERLTQSQRR